MASTITRGLRVSGSVLASTLLLFVGPITARASDNIRVPDAASVDLETLLQSALTHHPQSELFGARHRMISSEADAMRVHGGHTMVEAGIGLMTGSQMPTADMYRVEVMHTLANFSARRAAASIEAAKLAELTCEREVWELSLQSALIQTIAELHAQRETLRLLERDLEFIDHQLRSIESQASVGAINESALLTLRQMRIRSDVDLRIAEASTERAMSELSRLTGIRVDALDGINFDRILRQTSHPSASFAAAVQPKTIEQASLETRRATLQARREQAQRENRPEWSVGAMYQLSPMMMGHDALVDSHELMAMAAVTLPKPRAISASLRVFDAEASVLSAEAGLSRFAAEEERAELVRTLQSLEAQERALRSGLQEMQSALEALSARSVRFGLTSSTEVIATHQIASGLEKELISTQQRKAEAFAQLDLLSMGELSGRAPTCAEQREGAQ